MMKGFDRRKVVSAVLLFGIIQWILVVMLSEGVHPDYVSSIYYVSTLGTGETAFVYNASTIALGACILASSLLMRGFSSRAFFVLFMVTGLATVGVGVFPEDSRPMHGIVTPVALLGAALSAMASGGLHERPAWYFTLGLGAVSLVSGLAFVPYLGLDVNSRAMFLGLYKGTLERVVIYTNLLWVLILGSQLSTPE